MSTSDGMWRFPVTYEGLPQEQPFLVDATGDSLANDLILADTPQDLKLTVTVQQYTDLLSAALNGANRHFGERYIDVIYPLIKAGKELAGMSCEDVADCIESNPDVLQALLDQLAANGFSQSPENGNNTPELLPSYQSAESMLPATYDCSTPAQDMAIARAIVREIHETVMDSFEQLELATNTVESTAIITGALPLTKTATAALEFINWLQETFVEIYQAAYTQSAEDDIACAIFCHLQDACSLSLDELMAIYEELGTITLPDPTDFNAILQFFTTQVLSIDTTGVAAFHYLILQFFKFGGGFAELAGWNSLKLVIETASTYRDLSYDNLCDCFADTPTAQWALYMNFGLSQFGTFQSGVLGEYIANAGWRSVENANPAHVQVLANLGGSFVCRAAGIRLQGRGFTGTASDAVRVAGWTLPSGGGSENFNGSATGLGAAANINSYEYASLDLLEAGVSQSYKWSVQNAGASAYPTNFCQVNEVVVWGLAGAGASKPALAKWMPAMPSTTGEIFGLLDL